MAAAPTQMTAETLNAFKGWPNVQGAVDFSTTMDPTITKRVPAGSVLHVGPNLTFLLGVGDDFVMPMFAFSASDALDVSNATGGNPATQRGVWVPISPVGNMLALVANGAYELVSTNYAVTTYAPNDALTSSDGTDPDAGDGQLKKGTLGTDTICGVVSRGVVDNGYGHQALAFWPVFLPVYP